MELSYISFCLGKVIVFFDNYSLPILVGIQHLHKNSDWILCVSNWAKWLNVCLWSKWLWNQFLLQSLKLWISHLFQGRSSLTFRQLQHRFTPKRIWAMIRTQLKNVFSFHRFIKLFHSEHSQGILDSTWRNNSSRG